MLPMAIEVMATLPHSGVTKIRVLYKRKLPLQMGAMIGYRPAVTPVGNYDQWGDKRFGYVHGRRDTGNGDLYTIGEYP